MSYREWRLELCHWVWGMRRLFVAEGLLATPFTECLRGGAGGVHTTNILTIDPRVLGHHGRPKYALGPQDGGELSGVVWYVERVLDPAHKHPLTAVEDLSLIHI